MSRSALRTNKIIRKKRFPKAQKPYAKKIVMLPLSTY
jgi:hypothetical protein